MRRKIDKLTAMTAMSIAALLALCACSTTRRLGPGETRYTGIGKFTVNTASDDKLPADLRDELLEAATCDANDYLFAPFIKIPLGLWAYNNWPDSAKGIRGWLYDKVAKPPVLISEVRPQVRATIMEQILGNNGYFGSQVGYDVEYDKKNGRKATIDYNLIVSKPYRIDSIEYFGGKGDALGKSIDSLARISPYLQKGEIFCVDSLKAERIRMANALRDNGYYYFRPEYVEFLADSLLNPGSVALRLTFAPSMPRMAALQYRTGNVYTTVLRRPGVDAGEPDTMHTDRGEVIVMRPARLRPSLIPSCITFRKGRLFSVRNMDRTQTRLSRLGIFGNIVIQPVPVDTTPGHATLDVYTTCQFDDPMEASIEANVTSKSNSYLGPGLVLGLANRNTFGGGERLSVQLNADYEWQTGRNKSSVFNSYEFGIQTSLAFPRLLAPSWVKRRNRELNWTTVSLGASVLNRPSFFKLADFNTGISYQWQATRNSTNTFTPFKITYNKLISTTEAFDSVMNQNPAVAQSFRSIFIPQMSYTYMLDKFFERERINGINFSATVTEAGNIFAGIWELCGKHGEKKLFGTPFSQFVKGQVQLVYNRRLVRGADQWLVSRVLVGAEHAYGNSSEVPYSEQFYAGGANSVRAFSVRSIGPGSYRAPKQLRDGYFDQTGTFKFEFNMEYRFPIVSVLHGAVFLDTGNVWLLKDDPLRPGGKLEPGTFFKELAVGTGVGLRVDIGMMVLRGDLGYGLHAPYADAGPHYFNVPFKNAFAFHLAIGYPF